MSEELQHFGVKGMRWGVRKARSSSLGSKVSRAMSKKGSSKLEKKNEMLTKKLEAVKKKPQDMSDAELDTYFNRTLAISKLKKAAGNKSLDTISKGEAQRAFRNKDTLTTDELKKEADRLDKRANQLTSLRPSNNKKPGLIYKTGVGLVKDVVMSDKVVDKILSKTLKKANVKLDDRVVKAVGKVIKTTGNSLIDKAANEAYAKVIDSTAKNQYVVVDYRKKDEVDG